jgi:hypothetical protein
METTQFFPSVTGKESGMHGVSHIEKQRSDGVVMQHIIQDARRIHKSSNACIKPSISNRQSRDTSIKPSTSNGSPALFSVA